MTTETTVMTDGARLALRQYTEAHYGDLSDIPALVQTAYNAGFRESITAMVEFQDLPRQLRRIEDYVGKVCRMFIEHGVVEP